ncbi:MAG: glycosyltransferase [Bacteroidaceae bacterium]|nr:glycosyltransferase [Bacteroidaceae bacterium]
MIPKIIHLCWFSNDPYPVEIKVCLDSWRRHLPDYEIKRWTYEDAEAIGCGFINQALQQRKWAFAADVVRFYAVYTMGGIYMDSDIFLYRRFDELIPEHGFATFNEDAWKRERFGLQAAFFMGEKGNQFCKAMVDFYSRRQFIKDDGSIDQTISPFLMLEVAEKMGYKNEDKEQHLESLTVYPTYLLSPTKKYKRHKDAIGVHRIYGSWRKRKFGRRIEIWVKHVWHVVKYALFRR